MSHKVILNRHITPAELQSALRKMGHEDFPKTEPEKWVEVELEAEEHQPPHYNPFNKRWKKANEKFQLNAGRSLALKSLHAMSLVWFHEYNKWDKSELTISDSLSIEEAIGTLRRLVSSLGGGTFVEFYSGEKTHIESTAKPQTLDEALLFLIANVVGLEKAEEVKDVIASNKKDFLRWLHQ